MAMGLNSIIKNLGAESPTAKVLGPKSPTAMRFGGGTGSAAPAPIANVPGWLRPVAGQQDQSEDPGGFMEMMQRIFGPRR